MNINSLKRRVRQKQTRRLNLEPTQAVVCDYLGNIYDPRDTNKILVRVVASDGSLSLPTSVLPPSKFIPLQPGSNVYLERDKRDQLYIADMNVAAEIASGNNTAMLTQIKETTTQDNIETLRLVPSNPPSLTVKVKAWNPVIDGIYYEFLGAKTDLTVPTNPGDMYFACIFVLKDLTGLEVFYSTPRPEGDIALGVLDVRECISQRSSGSFPVAAVKLVNGQTAVTLLDIQVDGRALQQLINAFDTIYNQIVQKNGVDQPQEKKINLIEGTGITLTFADNPADGSTDITIASTGGSPSSFVFKKAVAAVAVANVNIAAPGTTLDSYTLVSGDRILLTAQSTASQNGLWVWTGAAAALTRPTDYPSGSTTLAFQYITLEVINGTVYTGTRWRMTTAGAITIDTTSQAWAKVITGVGSGGSGADLSAAGPGHLVQTGVGQPFATFKDNFAGSVAPTVSNDSSQGYGVGSLWFDQVANLLYMCQQSNVGAAVWVCINRQGTVTGPGSSTDRAFATWNSTGGNALRDNALAGLDSSGNANFFSIQNTPIGTTSQASGWFSSLRLKISGFFAIFTHANTADRTYTLPDASGNVLLDPLTTKGDLMVRTSTAPTRLPVGADNFYLTPDSTVANGMKYARLNSIYMTTMSPFMCARVTPTSGTPEEMNDVLDVTTLHLSPFKGDLISLYVSAASDFIPFANNSDINFSVPSTLFRNFDVFVYDTGSGLGVETVNWDQTSGAITSATNATPVVITATNTLSNGDLVGIAGFTGAGSANINGGVYVVSSASGSAFTLSGTFAPGALTAGTGTWYKIPNTRTTILNKVQGVDVKDGDFSRRYVCTCQTKGVSGKLDWAPYRRQIWNRYNQIPIILKSYVVAGHNYASSTIRPWNGGVATNLSTTPRIEFVMGLANQQPEWSMLDDAAVNAGGNIGICYVGLNSVSAGASPNEDFTLSTSTTRSRQAARGYCQPVAGYNVLTMLEQANTGQYNMTAGGIKTTLMM